MTPLPGSVGLSPVREGADQPRRPDPLAIRAARDFEAMLLRQLLSSLERTIQTGQRGPLSGGGQIHTSMMVDALANAMAAAGGIGLAAELLRAQFGTAADGSAARNSPGREPAQVSVHPAVQTIGSPPQAAR